MTKQQLKTQLVNLYVLQAKLKKLTSNEAYENYHFISGQIKVLETLINGQKFINNNHVNEFITYENERKKRSFF